MIAQFHTRQEAIRAIEREIRRVKTRMKALAPIQREEAKHEISQHERRLKTIDAIA